MSSSSGISFLFLFLFCVCFALQSEARSCYRQFRLFFHGWISSTLTPVLSLVLCLMIAVHFLAGLWFLAGDVDTGWVCLEGLHEASFARQYLRSVEWALSRLPASSLKGNVELNTAFERWLAIIATGIALIISSLFVSVLTNLMANAARRTRKMTQILGRKPVLFPGQGFFRPPRKPFYCCWLRSIIIDWDGF